MIRTTLRYTAAAILGAAVALSCGIEAYLLYVGPHGW
jgi:hypothetical protein